MQATPLGASDVTVDAVVSGLFLVGVSHQAPQSTGGLETDAKVGVSMSDVTRPRLGSIPSSTSPRSAFQRVDVQVV